MASRPPGPLNSMERKECFTFDGSSGSPIWSHGADPMKYEAEESKRRRRSRLRTQVVILFLQLLALIGLAAFCLSTLVTVCQILDQHQLAKGRGNGTACESQFPPFNYLRGASRPVNLAVNCAAMLLFIQGLLLATQLGGRLDSRDSGAAGMSRNVPQSLIFSNERQACSIHPQDFILRLIYRTACYDDIILREHLPTATGLPPEAMQRTNTYKLVQSRIKEHQLHDQLAFGAGGLGRTSYNIPVSLTNRGPVQIANDDYAADDALRAWGYNDWLQTQGEEDARVNQTLGSSR